MFRTKTEAFVAGLVVSLAVILLMRVGYDMAENDFVSACVATGGIEVNDSLIVCRVKEANP